MCVRGVTLPYPGDRLQREGEESEVEVLMVEGECLKKERCVCVYSLLACLLAPQVFL